MYTLIHCETQVEFQSYGTQYGSALWNLHNNIYSDQFRQLLLASNLK